MEKSVNLGWLVLIKVEHRHHAWAEKELSSPRHNLTARSRPMFHCRVWTALWRLSRRRQTEWPDVGIKSSPNISKTCPKSSHISFTQKVMYFRLAQKVKKYLSFFARKFVKEQPLTIAQSGHTAARVVMSSTKISYHNFMIDEIVFSIHFFFSL